MSKDWLKESLKKTRKFLAELPETKKQALEFEAQFRNAQRKAEQNKYIRRG